MGLEEETLGRAAPCENVVRTKGLTVFGARLPDPLPASVASAWLDKAQRASRAAADGVCFSIRPAGYQLDAVDLGLCREPPSRLVRQVGFCCSPVCVALSAES